MEQHAQICKDLGGSLKIFTLLVNDWQVSQAILGKGDPEVYLIQSLLSPVAMQGLNSFAKFKVKWSITGLHNLRQGTDRLFSVPVILECPWLKKLYEFFRENDIIIKGKWSVKSKGAEDQDTQVFCLLVIEVVPFKHSAVTTKA